MTSAIRGPFRADHVGSLLRPAALREARERAILGEVSFDSLRELEDASIRDAIELQESIGLQGITDGEFRRTSFHFDFLGKLAGVTASLNLPQRKSEETTGTPAVFRPPQVQITGKLRHTQSIEGPGFSFLKAETKRTAKVTMPSPTMCLRGGREAVSRDIYPDLADYWADVTRAYDAEIADLIARGATYIQLDDTNFAYLCDSRMREEMRAKGDEPADVLGRYIWLINGVTQKRPSDVALCVHICRGNLHGRWAAEGGYEPIAERLFGELDVDGFFLEYESERAGGFEPLRFVPKGTRTRIVLGLISSKSPEIEDDMVILRRIDEAAKFVDLDNLCLSPQCGFASSFRGNQIAEDVQRRKLEQVVRIATRVWGGAR
jgi:5-methyltetrahydropteroyltriglutamate--homocysteine methyltransferase